MSMICGISFFFLLSSCNFICLFNFSLIYALYLAHLGCNEFVMQFFLFNYPSLCPMILCFCAGLGLAKSCFLSLCYLGIKKHSMFAIN